MTNSTANPFGQQVIDAVATHMNKDHPEDCLLIVRTLGKCADATAATVSGLDGESIEFEAIVDGEPTSVRVPWSMPLTERPQIRTEVTRMYYETCAVLGVSPRGAEEH